MQGRVLGSVFPVVLALCYPSNPAGILMCAQKRVELILFCPWGVTAQFSRGEQCAWLLARALLCSMLMFLFTLVFPKTDCWKCTKAKMPFGSSVPWGRLAAGPGGVAMHREWRVLLVCCLRIHFSPCPEAFTAEFLLNLRCLSLTREQMESVREALHPKMVVAGSSLAACADKLIFFKLFFKVLPHLKLENML